MKLGAYSPEIERGTVEEVFAEARRLGFEQMQYNFSTSHGEEMPERVAPAELGRIRNAALEHGIEIVAVNGTFNMIDPDRRRCMEYVRRFPRIAEACRALGGGIVTLCTGSRNPNSMWAWHPDNESGEAWADLIETTGLLLPVAEEYDLTLGVETEASNVVFTSDRTRRYLDEIASPRLKVIIDCANLFPAGTARRENVRPAILRAFELLGRDIVLAHGKDILESDASRFAAPGAGIVDYGLYFGLLKELGYNRGLILHGIHRAEEFGPSVRAMREQLAAAGI